MSKYLAILAALATCSACTHYNERNVTVETRSKEVYEIDSEGRQIKNTIITGEVKY